MSRWLAMHDRDGRVRPLVALRWALAYAGGFFAAMLDQRAERRR